MSITACGNCGAQWNTASMAPNTQFQCGECGAIVVVPAQAPRQQAPQQPQQRQAPQQRRAAPPQQRRGSLPQGRGQPVQRGGSAQRGMPGGGAPGGYQQPGTGGQQGPGRPGFPVQKKSNSGVIVGIIIGLVVLVVVVLVIALGSGNTHGVDQAEIDDVIATINSWDYNNRPQEIRMEDIEKAEEFNQRGLLPGKGDDDVKNWTALISNARTALNNYETNQKTKKSNAMREKAATEILATANALHTAIENGEVATIVGMTDWAEIALCAQGKSEKVQTYRGLPAEKVDKLLSPLTHEFEFELKKSSADAKDNVYVVNFGSLRSIDSMKTDGLQEILDFYSHEASVLGDHKPDAKALTMKVINEDSELLPVDVSGIPKSVFPDQGSDYYYGWVLYNIPRGRGDYAPNGELSAYIGGKWGEPARVLYLFADIDGEMARVKRDNVSAANDPNYGDGSGGDKYVEKRDIIQQEEAVSLIPDPDGGKFDSLKVSKRIDDASSKVVSAKLREALTEGGNGNTVTNYVDDLKSASDSDKLAMIAGVHNEILAAMNKSEAAAETARAKLSALLAQGLTGWRYMENNIWIMEFRGFARSVSGLKADLQMLEQCYELIKAAKAEGK